MAAGRRNGWQKPFASQFILLQAIFYSSALIFYLYIQFIQQPQWFIIGESSEMLFGPMRITLLVVASISLLIAYSSSMYASIKDPGDPIIYHLECEQGQLKKYCEICKSSV